MLSLIFNRKTSAWGLIWINYRRRWIIRLGYFYRTTYIYIMSNDNIPDIILEEAKHLPDDLLKEVLDFILFLKNKSQSSSAETTVLSSLQKDELTHLEGEFENYKLLYPNE